jgi:hypothetical protein
VAARANGDMLADRYHLDALTGRFEARRTVIRGGRTRRVQFVKRLFGFPELRATGRGIHRGDRLRRGRAADARRSQAHGYRRWPAITVGDLAAWAFMLNVAFCDRPCTWPTRAVPPLTGVRIWVSSL